VRGSAHVRLEDPRAVLRRDARTLIDHPYHAAVAAPLPDAPDCPVFPASNVWNTPVGSLPKHKRSAKIAKAIGAGLNVHADFGSGLWEGGPIGIPVTVVDGSQATSLVDFRYDEESDPGPYPIPPDVAIEGGPGADGDRHAIIVDSDSCTLYELFDLWPAWDAGSGAIWNLRSNALRPRGWTSADAAGLPILPGLARYDEVASGVLRASPDQVTEALVEAFGGPATEAVPVIVLNGNGVPGIGEAVAERIIPGGFRVAVSQNASDFDHAETLIVVGSPDDVALAERVRDLLGVGSVSVSVGSGIAPVTVVVGKDFTG